MYTNVPIRDLNFTNITDTRKLAIIFLFFIKRTGSYKTFVLFYIAHVSTVIKVFAGILFGFNIGEWATKN